MEEKQEFVLEDGVLVEYHGPGGEVIIPDGVKEIGEYAFWNQSAITSVRVPGSVTSVGTEAFSGCSSLTRVVFPDSLTRLARDTFSGCDTLREIRADGIMVGMLLPVPDPCMYEDPEDGIGFIMESAEDELTFEEAEELYSSTTDKILEEYAQYGGNQEACIPILNDFAYRVLAGEHLPEELVNDRLKAINIRLSEEPREFCTAMLENEPILRFVAQEKLLRENHINLLRELAKKYGKSSILLNQMLASSQQ